MTSEKHDSVLDEFGDVAVYFVPEIAERLRASGLDEINKVDQFVGWLFSSDSLRELGFREVAVRQFAEVGIETAGDLVVKMTKTRKRPHFIR